LDGIKNFYYSSIFDVVVFFELIVLRAFGRMLTDFLYHLRFLRETRPKGAKKCKETNNDQQNTSQKTKDWTTPTTLKKISIKQKTALELNVK
jgi:hypothetical protein